MIVQMHKTFKITKKINYGYSMLDTFLDTTIVSQIGASDL